MSTPSMNATNVANRSSGTYMRTLVRSPSTRRTKAASDSKLPSSMFWLAVRSVAQEARPRAGAHAAALVAQTGELLQEGPNTHWPRRYELPNLGCQCAKLLLLEDHVPVRVHTPQHREPAAVSVVQQGSLDVVPPLLSPVDQAAVN